MIFAYNTTHRMVIGKSLYFLVYGQEALQPIEMEVETFRVMVQDDYMVKERVRT